MKNKSYTRERSAKVNDRKRSGQTGGTGMKGSQKSSERHSGGGSGRPDEKERNRSTGAPGTSGSGSGVRNSSRNERDGGAPSRQTSGASDEIGQL